jgi:hypothetical protein
MLPQLGGNILHASKNPPPHPSGSLHTLPLPPPATRIYSGGRLPDIHTQPIHPYQLPPGSCSLRRGPPRISSASRPSPGRKCNGGTSTTTSTVHFWWCANSGRRPSGGLACMSPSKAIGVSDRTNCKLFSFSAVNGYPMDFTAGLIRRAVCNAVYINQWICLKLITLPCTALPT